MAIRAKLDRRRPGKRVAGVLELLRYNFADGEGRDDEWQASKQHYDTVHPL